MTIPISHGLDDRHVDTSEPREFDDFVNRRLVPLVRNLRLIANESNTAVENAHTTATYEWNLDRMGTVFINKTSGAALAVSADSSVELPRLRQGRRYCLVVYNGTGGALAVSFSSDFVASAIAIAAGDTAGWDLIVKDSGFGPSGTLMEI